MHKANRRKPKARIYCGRFLRKTCMKQTKGKAADQISQQCFEKIPKTI